VSRETFFLLLSFHPQDSREGERERERESTRFAARVPSSRRDGERPRRDLSGHAGRISRSPRVEGGVPSSSFAPFPLRPSVASYVLVSCGPGLFGNRTDKSVLNVVRGRDGRPGPRHHGSLCSFFAGVFPGVRLSASFFASFSIGEHVSVVKGLIASRVDARAPAQRAPKLFFFSDFFSFLLFFFFPSSFPSSAISFGRRRAAGILQS